MTRVSVITPVYNGEKFIGQAIETVLTQTWQDWELIIINDGSTDQTATIVERYQDSRIRVIHQTNQGEGAARNTGLENAQGEYVAWLDADDSYLPNALADGVAYLDKNPQIGVVYADGWICDEHNQNLMRLSEHRMGFFTGDVLEQVVLSNSLITVPSCTMIRRQVVEKVLLQFDSALKFGTDWDFWIRLARTTQFGYLDKVVCRYRVHQANISRTIGINKKRSELIKGRLKTLESSWFKNLSLETRFVFVRDLLLGLLAGDREQQWSILVGEGVISLPALPQALLFRLTATHALLHYRQSSFCRQCLEKAITLNPSDPKSITILMLLTIHPILCYIILLGWHWGNSVVQNIKRLGKRHPKPVPLSLTKDISG